MGDSSEKDLERCSSTSAEGLDLHLLVLGPWGFYNKDYMTVGGHSVFNKFHQFKTANFEDTFREYILLLSSTHHLVFGVTLLWVDFISGSIYYILEINSKSESETNTYDTFCCFYSFIGVSTFMYVLLLSFIYFGHPRHKVSPLKLFLSVLYIVISIGFLETVTVYASRAHVLQSSFGVLPTLLAIYLTLPIVSQWKFVMAMVASGVPVVSLLVTNAAVPRTYASFLLSIFAVNFVACVASINRDIKLRHIFYNSILYQKKLVTIEKLKSTEVRLKNSILPYHMQKHLSLVLNAHKAYNSFRNFPFEFVPNVTILFADIVGFTDFSSKVDPETLIFILNTLFTKFDSHVEHLKLDKISTIGDCYFLCGNLLQTVPDHARRVVEMAYSMLNVMEVYKSNTNVALELRIGIHTGSVMGGIVGLKKVCYDVWSNDVAVANKLENLGTKSRIHISQTTKDLLDQDLYTFEPKYSNNTSSLSRNNNSNRNAQNKYPFNMNTYLVSKKSNSRRSSKSNSSNGSTDDVKPKCFDNMLLSRSDEVMGDSIIKLIQAKSLRLSPCSSIIGNLDASNRSYEGGVNEVDKSLFTLEEITLETENELSDDNDFALLRESLGHVACTSNMSSSTSISNPTCYTTANNTRRCSLAPVSRTSDPLYKNENSLGSNDESDTNIVAAGGESSSNYATEINSTQSVNDIVYGEATGDFTSNIWGSDDVRAKNEDTTNTPDTVTVIDCDGIALKNNKKKNTKHLKSGLPVCNVIDIHNTSTISDKSMVSRRLSIISGAEFIDNLISAKNSSGSVSAKDQDNETVMKKTLYSLEDMVRYIGHCIKSRFALEYKDEIERFSEGRQITPKYEMNRWTYTFTTPRLEKLYETCYVGKAWKAMALRMGITMFIYAIVAPIPFTTYDSSLDNGRYTLIWLITYCVSGLLMLGLISLTIVSGAMKKATIHRLKEHALLRPLAACLHSANLLNVYGLLLFAIACASIIVVFLLEPKENPHLFMSCFESVFLALELTIILYGSLKMVYSMPMLVVAFLAYMVPLLVLRRGMVERIVMIIIVEQLAIILYLHSVDKLERLYYLSTVNYHYLKVLENKRTDYINILCNLIFSKAQSEKFLNLIQRNKVENIESHRWSEKRYCGVMFVNIWGWDEQTIEENAKQKVEPKDSNYEDELQNKKVLNEIICELDGLLDKKKFWVVEKIKVIGNTYMLAIGLNDDAIGEGDDGRDGQYLKKLIHLANEMFIILERFNYHAITNYTLKVGINNGYVIAGLIGTKRLSFDIWGDTVNVASRMCTTSKDGRIQIPARFCHLLQGFQVEQRGKVFVKGKGSMDTLYIGSQTDVLEIGCSTKQSNRRRSSLGPFLSASEEEGLKFPNRISNSTSEPGSECGTSLIMTPLSDRPRSIGMVKANRHVIDFDSLIHVLQYLDDEKGDTSEGGEAYK